MNVTFACPECGAVLSLKRLGPGRQLRCEHCETLVEVPFLPRARRTRRRRDPNWVPWVWAGGGVVLTLAVLIGGGRLVRSLVAEAARSRAPAPEATVPRAEVEDRLAEIEVEEEADPAGAVGSYQDLLGQIERSRPLADLANQVRARLDRARRLAAEADLAAAKPLVTSDPARAASLCERALRQLDELNSGPGDPLRDEARTVATQVASRAGVAIEPIQGRFLLGTARSLSAEIHPPLAEALARHGYAPAPADPALRAIWDQHAAYRLKVEVNEIQGPAYLQSPNHTTEIDAALLLARSGDPLWQATLSARTQVPLPNLPVFEANRLALGTKHSPEVERRFYKDALDALLGKLGVKLRDLPARVD